MNGGAFGSPSAVPAATAAAATATGAVTGEAAAASEDTSPEAMQNMLLVRWCRSGTGAEVMSDVGGLEVLQQW